MDIKLLNKKRKLIVLFSLIITILLLIIFIFGELLLINFATGIFKISMMTLILLLFLALLYLFSRFVIIPLYNKLKIIVFEKIINDKFKENLKVKSVSFNKDIEYLYNKNNLDILNSFSFNYKDYQIKIYDFIFNTKKGFRNTKCEFKGKYLSLPLKTLNLPDMAFIMQNKNKSESFNNYFKNKFNNVNSEITIGKKYLRYNCYFNENKDFKIVSILEDIKDFASLIIKNNVLTIYFHENINPFEFKLKNKIDKNIYFDCKDSYNTSLNLINKILIMDGNINGK